MGCGSLCGRHDEEYRYCTGNPLSAVCCVFLRSIRNADYSPDTDYSPNTDAETGGERAERRLDRSHCDPRDHSDRGGGGILVPEEKKGEGLKGAQRLKAEVFKRLLQRGSGLPWKDEPRCLFVV